MDKLTVRDLDAHGKHVFLRVDFNVPLEDGRVTDDSRIRASLPTIHHLLMQGARVVLASHLGRPDGKVHDGLRLRPVGERLSQLLRRNIPVTGDALGPGTEDAIKRLRPGDALMLENLRFHSEEEANDPKFAATLASYAEVYVNDAFGTAHRAHASTVGVPKLLPAYAGLLMEREISALSKLLEDPEHPFVAIVGGAKVSGKLKVLDNLIRRIDRLILGGGMANTFLLAQGRSVGKSLAEHDMVDQARRVLGEAEKKGVQVILPVDVVVAKEVTRGTEYKTLPAEKIPASWHIVDVGSDTLTLIEQALIDARTIMWNGPIGVFEIPVFGAGTRHVARILAEKADGGATVVVGGGDSVAAVQQQGLAARMTHISTGGGASLEFLEGRELPGIAVLLDRKAAEVPEPVTVPEPVAAPKPAVAARPAARKPVAPKPVPAKPVAAAKGATAPKPVAPPTRPAPRPARPAKPAAPPKTAAPRAASAPTRPAPRRAAAPVAPKKLRPAKRAPATRQTGVSRKPAAAKRIGATRKATAPGRAAPSRRATTPRRPAVRGKPTAPKRSGAPRRAAAAAAKKPNPSRKAAPQQRGSAAKKKPAAPTRATASKQKPATPKRAGASKSAAGSGSRKPNTSKKPSAAKRSPKPSKRPAVSKGPSASRKNAPKKKATAPRKKATGSRAAAARKAPTARKASPTRKAPTARKALPSRAAKRRR